MDNPVYYFSIKKNTYIKKTFGIKLIEQIVLLVKKLKKVIDVENK